MNRAWQTIKPFLTPYRWRILLVFLSVVAVTGGGLFVPWLVRNLIRILRTADGEVAAVQNQVIGTAVLLLLAYGVRSYGQYLSFHHSHVVAWNVCHDLRSALYQQLQRFSPVYYAERQTGEVVSRVLKDTDNLEPIIADAVYDFLVSILLSLGVLAILLSIDPWLTLLAFAPLPFIILTILIMRRPAIKIFQAEADNMGEVSALVQDNLSGIRDIQIYNRENYELNRVVGLSKQLATYQIRARQIVAGMFPLIEGATGLSTVIAVGLGAVRVLNGRLQIEDLVAFVLYLAGVYQPLWQLASIGEWLERGVASLRRIREVLSAKPDIDELPDGIALESIKGDLTLENVTFAYQEENVLQNVSLSVPAGETLAIVGPTGAGKSTLANLLSRFYDPQGGKILLDGHDLRALQLENLRGNLSMVLQDVFLFYASVKENIRFAKPDATDEEIIAAAKVADAHNFILELPNGYETLVGERGIKLSGGQKQRISIARAILKDAPILILDEATSSVDTQTEAQIQAALGKLMAGRTSVVIAHRLSTIRNANQIAVLDEGRVVELGNHDEITQQGGLYARLLAGQAV
ncbi:MAG: ABC transporter ATP-binding protein [Chloroflexota bacterium]